MSTDLLLDVASAVLLLLGAAMSLAAGLGLLRFRDLISRMHAQSKPQIAGLLFILIGIALQHPQWRIVLFLAPIMFFTMLTAPVAAGMLARSGYRNRHFRHEDLLVDELLPVVEGIDERRASALGTGQGVPRPLPGDERPTVLGATAEEQERARTDRATDDSR
ncbi:MAG: monovalent cation/H(+) antiporter subunit G [Pseudoclavibacter sp.]|nr:monovalent cation/H(+) antiporter subunit G [Pseudoclavibacter sp.]